MLRRVVAILNTDQVPERSKNAALAAVGRAFAIALAAKRIVSARMESALVAARGVDAAAVTAGALNEIIPLHAAFRAALKLMDVDGDSGLRHM
jgi:hypothetical protein